MNARAIGCIAAGCIIFVLIGIAGLNLASSRVGCPSGIQWQDLAYGPQGTPAPSPMVGEDSPVKLGSTFIGLTTRTVYGPAAAGASPSGPNRPRVIALDCADGTFQTYRNTGVIPASSPRSTGGS